MIYALFFLFCTGVLSAMDTNKLPLMGQGPMTISIRMTDIVSINKFVDKTPEPTLITYEVLLNTGNRLVAKMFCPPTGLAVSVLVEYLIISQGRIVQRVTCPDSLSVYSKLEAEYNSLPASPTQ